MNGYFNVDENGGVTYTIEGWQNKFHIYIEEGEHDTKDDYMMYINRTKEVVYLDCWTLEEAFIEAIKHYNF